MPALGQGGHIHLAGAHSMWSGVLSLVSCLYATSVPNKTTTVRCSSDNRLEVQRRGATFQWRLWCKKPARSPQSSACLTASPAGPAMTATFSPVAV